MAATKQPAVVANPRPRPAPALEPRLAHVETLLTSTTDPIPAASPAPIIELTPTVELVHKPAPKPAHKLTSKLPPPTKDPVEAPSAPPAPAPKVAPIAVPAWGRNPTEPPTIAPAMDPAALPKKAPEPAYAEVFPKGKTKLEILS